MNAPEALLREPSPDLSGCLLTFRDREPIDSARAREQHEAYRRALERSGFRVTSLPPDPDDPDAVFVEDPAVVFSEAAVLTTLGTPSRRHEGKALAAWLRRRREVVRLEAGARLEGGDVLHFGGTFFVGRSRRTDDFGIQAFEDVVNAYGYRVVAIEVHGCLHLKTAVTAIDADTVLANPRWIDTEPLRGLRVIEVDEREPFGANVVRAGTRILASASWKRTADRLASHGCDLELVELSEFEKAEGGATCLSLLLF